jgi:hypothetical protein
MSNTNTKNFNLLPLLEKTRQHSKRHMDTIILSDENISHEVINSKSSFSILSSADNILESNKSLPLSEFHKKYLKYKNKYK